MQTGQAFPGDPPVVEREHELGVLDNLVDAVRAGRGGGVVVEGVAGIGKTRLLRLVADRAAAAGIPTLDARGSGLERDFAFGVVRQLLEWDVRATPPAQQAQLFTGSARPAAGLLLDGHDASGPPDGDAFAVLHGLYWLLANLVEAGPRLLVVDDLQWADDASQRFVAFLAARLAGLPLGLVTAVRTGEGVLSEPVLTVERQPETEVLRPAALSPAGVATLIESALGPADPQFVDACVDATGGVPFYARELVAELARDRIAPTAANLNHVAGIRPESVSRSVMVRIAHLPGEAVAVAQALAVLGDTNSEETLAELAGVERDAAQRAIAGMQSVGMLAADRLAYAHPIMGGAVYADLADAARADAHGRAARLLRDKGEGAELVSAHLLRAPAGTCEWGVDVLRTAARTALEHGAAGDAVTLLRRARAESIEPAARSELTFELGRAEWHAGLPDAIDHLDHACDEGSGAPWWPQAVLFLARALTVAGRLDDAARFIDGVTEDLTAASPEIAAQATNAFVLAARASPEFHEMSIARLRELGRRTSEFDTPTGRLLLGDMAFDEIMRNEPAARVAERARQAWGAGDLLMVEPPGSPQFWAIMHTRIGADDVDGAEDALQHLLAESRRRGSATGYAMARVLRSMLGLRRGSLLEAEADADEALALGDQFALGYPSAIGVAVEARVERGELTAAEKVLVTNEIPPELSASGVHAICLTARALLRMRQRQWSAARDDCLAAGHHLLSWASTSPTLLPWRSRAALALAGLGDQDAAARLAHEELEMAESFGSPHTSGIALQAVGQIAGGTERRECFTRAVDILEGTPFQLESARALVGLGTDLRRADDTSAARDQLRRGLDLAARCGATPIAERARQELIASGARPRRSAVTGVDALTATERRICTLAADGGSNREVAQELFVTVKTVEMHLTNSYRKLGIASRGELPAALEPHTDT